MKYLTIILLVFLSCTCFAQKKRLSKTDNFDTVKVVLLVADTTMKFVHEFKINGYAIKKPASENFIGYLDERKKALKKSIILIKAAEIDWLK